MTNQDRHLDDLQPTQEDLRVAKQAIAKLAAPPAQGTAEYEETLYRMVDLRHEWGASFFALFSGLQEPRDGIEQAIKDFTRNEIDNKAFDLLLDTQRKRPLDQEMLGRFCDTCLEWFEVYRQVIKAIADDASNLSSSRCRTTGTAMIDRLVNELAGIPLVMEEWGPKVNPFIMKVRLRREYKQVCINGCTAPTAHMLVELKLPYVGKLWQQCKQMAHNSRTDPRYTRGVTASVLFCERFSEELPKPNELETQLMMERVAAQEALQKQEALQPALPGGCATETRPGQVTPQEGVVSSPIILSGSTQLICVCSSTEGKPASTTIWKRRWVMNNDLLETALACIKAVVSVIPINHANKRPAFRLLPRDEEGMSTWKPYQDTIANEATVRQWFGSGIQSFAVVCGRVSGGLLVLDFDDPRFYDKWRQAVGGLADGLPVQQTGGGGYQVLGRCPEPGGNQKLAWATDLQEPTGRSIAIETRGEGGYAIVAPSLHPSGKRYKMLSGTLTDIPTLSQAHAEAILAAARKLDEAPFAQQDQQQDIAQDQGQHGSANRRAGVIDAYNAAYTVDDLLDRYGYTQGNHGRYIRPGGKSESVGTKDGHSCHWSSNDPLNDGCDGGGYGCHDAFGLYTHMEHGGSVSQAVKAAAQLLGIEPTNSTPFYKATVPSTSASIQPYHPFPLDVLPGPIASFAHMSAQAMCCDPCFVALPLLVGLASAVGNSRRVQLKRCWTEPAILWGAIVGESGSMKSPALELALSEIRQRQERAIKEHRQALDRWKLNHEHLDAQKAKWTKKASKDPAAGDPPMLPDPPVGERCWTDDVTIEAMAMLLQDNPRGLVMIRDELSGWLHFDRYSTNGRGSESARWMEMHRGQALAWDRKTSGTVIVPHAAVSIIGGIQPGILARYIGQEHRDNGLLARLLLAMPPRRPKYWTEEDIDPADQAVVTDTFNRLYGLEPASGPGRQPCPAIVGLSHQGKRAWISFYNEHNQEQADLTGDLAAAWSKLEGYAARFALVHHLIRGALGDDMGSGIDAASVRAGATLSRWFAHEARRVYAMLAQDDSGRERQRLIELIERKGKSVSIRQWQRTRSHQSAQKAQAELALLVDAGLGRWEEVAPGPKGGRSSKRFVLAGQTNQPNPITVLPTNLGNGSTTSEAEMAEDHRVGAAVSPSDTTSPLNVQINANTVGSVVSSVLSVSEPSTEQDLHYT